MIQSVTFVNTTHVCSKSFGFFGSHIHNVHYSMGKPFHDPIARGCVLIMFKIVMAQVHVAFACGHRMKWCLSISWTPRSQHGKDKINLLANCNSQLMYCHHIMNNWSNKIGLFFGFCCIPNLLIRHKGRVYYIFPLIDNAFHQSMMSIHQLLISFASVV
jgi:hypothetical protein